MNYVDNQIIFMIGFALLLFIFPIISTIKKKKSNNAKEKLSNNNEFVLKNKEMIEKSLDMNSQELKSYRIRTLVALIFFIMSLASFVIIDNKAISIALCIIMTIIFGVCYVSYNNKNSEKYDEIVQKTLHEIDSDFSYSPNAGFTEEEYKLCLFPEMCDRFSSEDMITNTKNNFCYSDILVESEHEDSDDRTYYITEFAGSLAKINIKNTNCRIYLGSTKEKFIFGKNDYIRINFENDEFNDLFRACSNNELLAYKILTPDVMEEFVNIKKNTYGDIDIRIIDDRLYIRFLTGNTFDSKLFGKESEKKELLQSIAILEEVMKTMEKVKGIIENKNMD